MFHPELTTESLEYIIIFLQVKLLEQNTVAQENICRALVDAYANFSASRRYIQDIISKRNSTITALITSYDTYDDLLGKANKGIEFYNKLETNVSKLLQRIKSASKVQEEEREQMLAKVVVKSIEPAVNTKISTSGTPKLKDYLDSMKKESGQFITPTYPGSSETSWSPGVRPAPLGSEMNVESGLPTSNDEQGRYTAPNVYPNSHIPYLPSGSSYGTYSDQQYSLSNQQHLQFGTQQQTMYSQHSPSPTPQIEHSASVQTQEQQQSVFSQFARHQAYTQLQQQQQVNNVIL